jgi:hypothetical protein
MYFKADQSLPLANPNRKISYTYLRLGGITIGISCMEAGSPPPLTLTSWFKVKTSLLNDEIETEILFCEKRAIKFFIFLGFEILTAYSVIAFRQTLLGSIHNFIPQNPYRLPKEIEKKIIFFTIR